jgi:hypothetical protein
MSLDKKIETYVITSAQACAPVNKNFLHSLETYCNFNNAQLLILPMQGKNIHEEDLSKSLYDKEIIFGDYNLNNKIKIKDYKVKPQAIRPLTGLEPLVKGDRSAIIAGTKINLRAVPNSNTRMAKLLMTTGALTHPRYNKKHRTGKIAEMDHEYGAVVVEIVNGKKYHVRYIEAAKNGKFYDLGTHYNGDKVTIDQRINSLILGDLHTTETDEKALNATLEMLHDLNPENIFLHDMFNGSSISHHHLNDLVELHHYYGENKLSLENELKTNAEMLQLLLTNIPKDGQIYIVASNHNEALDRYLREGRFINEPQNVELGCDLLKAYFKGNIPLQEGLSYFMNIPDNVHFLKRGDDLRIFGYYLAEHGDRGANGARGNPNVYSKTLEKSITGHSHSCFKHRHTVKVGTLSKLQLRYNKGGTSNWTQTNGILHPNGKTQLVHLIDGKYHLDK